MRHHSVSVHPPTLIIDLIPCWQDHHHHTTSETLSILGTLLVNNIGYRTLPDPSIITSVIQRYTILSTLIIDRASKLQTDRP